MATRQPGERFGRHVTEHNSMFIFLLSALFISFQSESTAQRRRITKPPCAADREDVDVWVGPSLRRHIAADAHINDRNRVITRVTGYNTELFIVWRMHGRTVRYVDRLWVE